MINVLVVLFLFICFYSVKFKKQNYYEDNLSKDNTTAMKGLFAVSIVLCHLSEMPGVDNLYFFKGTGNLGVSMFFFLSGYGLMCSYNKNGIKGFIKKRFSSVLIPFIFAEIISYCAFYFIPGVHGLTQETYTLSSFITKFIQSGSTLIINGWYVFEILLLYILFYVSFAVFSKNKKAGIACITFLTAAVTLFFAVLTHYTEWIQFWAYSTMSFAYGILWSEYKTVIESFLKKRYAFCFIFFTAMTVLCFFSNYIFDKFDFFPAYNINTTFLSRYLTSPFFIVLVMLISMKLKSENKVLLFLGNISYEIYLYHGLIYCILRSGSYADVKNDLLYCVLTLALSIDTAYIMNFAANKTREWTRINHSGKKGELKNDTTITSG